MKHVMSVPEAGEKLDLGRDAAYAAARRGDIPVLRIGRRLVVPVAQFEAMLAGEWTPDQSEVVSA